MERSHEFKPALPLWVAELLASAATVEPIQRANHILPPLTLTVAGRYACASVHLSQARACGPQSLRDRVRDAYLSIAAELSRRKRYPIRFWNFVPGIGEPLGDGLDRYMVFNRGRYDAYQRWYANPSAFASSIATASAVGVEGEDLAIHCLAADSPGVPVDNPRQIAAWRYSRRYGPAPPCFARGTIARFGQHQVLLVGGTASIVGEDSRHLGNVTEQSEETLTNLAVLVARACGVAEGRALGLLRDVRIYVTDSGTATGIEGLLRARCTGAPRIETAVARLCRPELLVEIEAVATVPTADRPPSRGAQKTRMARPAGFTRQA